MRFRSRGVEAAFLTADLDASLSNTVTLTMGKEQARDDQRVEEVLAAGAPLIGHPISTDGSDNKVLQYVGEYEDIAFMIFEVSEKESEYVSLTPRTPQALRLAINTNEATHHGTKGLKIEVYLNGALSDVHYVNPKKMGSASTYKSDGTRIHRQIEKPWTYQPPSALPPSVLSAEERWRAASTSLKKDVRLRGIDEWGDRPPTADYLAALAEISLPSCLKDSAHMGIIDVIIASGLGVKDIHSAGYIMRPTHLRSNKYHPRTTPAESDRRQRSPGHEESDAATHDIGAVEESESSSPFPFRASLEEEDPFADTQGVAPAKSPLSYSAPEPRSASPKVPLAVVKQTKPKLKLNAPKARALKLTATEHAAKDFADKNGIAWRQDASIENFQDRRGAEKGNRSLTHRIMDLQKMTPKNKAVVVKQLQQDFPLEHDTPPRSASAVRLNFKSLDSRLSAAAKPSTGASQPKSNIKTGRNTRTSLAVDYGATPGGSLLKRIESYSPSKVDERAETLMDGSSSSVPQTPQQEEEALSVVRSSSVRKTSHKSSKLNDQTPEEALAAFRLPDECHGSVISYADGNAQRQISKTRPGVFEEDEVIVGMRFVLL